MALEEISHLDSRFMLKSTHLETSPTTLTQRIFYRVSLSKLLLATLLGCLLQVSGSPIAVSAPDATYNVGGDAFLKGTYVEVGVNANGYFGTAASAPTGMHSNMGGRIGFRGDRNRDGSWADGDFFLPGSPYEGFYVDAGGVTGKSYGGGSPSGFASISPLSTVDVSANRTSVIHTSLVNGVKVEQTYSVGIGTAPTTFSGDQQLDISVTLTNTTGATLPNIYYARHVDPDNLVRQGGSYTTTNKIEAQYGSSGSLYSLVSATASDSNVGRVGQTSYLGLFSSDSRSKVFRNTSGFGVLTSAASAYDGSGAGMISSATDTGASADAGIGIGFNLGSLSAGASTTFSFSYVLSTTAASAAVAGASAPPAPIAIPGDGNVALSWTAPTSADPIVKYEISYRLETATSFETITTTDSSTAFTVPSLTNGLKYVFKIAAVTSPGGVETLGTYSDLTSANLVGGPVWITATLGSLHVGETISLLLQATRGETYTVVSGMPSGLNLDTSTATISGSPTSAGTYTLVLRVANEYGYVDKTFTGSITIVPPVWVTTSIGSITSGNAISINLVATGATSYSIVSGLPAGLVIETSTGAISGTPTTSGTYTLVVRATNGGGSTDRTFTGIILEKVTVMPDPVQTSNIISISPNSGSNGTKIVITGNFPTPITNISIGGIYLSAGSWTQSATEIVFVAPTHVDGLVEIQLFNGMAPLLPVQGFRYSPTNANSSAQSTTTAGNSTSSTAATSPTIGSLDPVMSAPSESNNYEFVLVDGKRTSITIDKNFSGNGLEVRASDWTLNLAGHAKNGVQNKVDPQNRIVVEESLNVSTSGSGFKPNSVVKLFVFSSPILIAAIKTDGDGKFSGIYQMPLEVKAGEHTLQLNGYSPSDEVRSATVGLIVLSPKVISNEVTLTPTSKPSKFTKTVIPFKFAKFKLNNSQLKVVENSLQSNKLMVRVIGYAQATNGNDDVRISLDRALEVKAAIMKLYPNASVQALGGGVVKNRLCVQYKNKCAVITIVNK